MAKQRPAELAHWLTRPDHPLTSRVFVNRVWYWHFGEDWSGLRIISADGETQPSRAAELSVPFDSSEADGQ